MDEAFTEWLRSRAIPEAWTLARLEGEMRAAFEADASWQRSTEVVERPGPG